MTVSPERAAALAETIRRVLTHGCLEDASWERPCSTCADQSRAALDEIAAALAAETARADEAFAKEDEWMRRGDNFETELRIRTSQRDEARAQVKQLREALERLARVRIVGRWDDPVMEQYIGTALNDARAALAAVPVEEAATPSECDQQATAESSKGRTAAFEAENPGSTPGSAVIVTEDTLRAAGFVVVLNEPEGAAPPSGPPYPPIWEEAERLLLTVLDDDDAVSALQVLQREGFALSRAALSPRVPPPGDKP